jgi:sulfate adenylyltransferase subunit 1
MDLMAYEESVFTAIQAEYHEFSQKLESADIRFIPLSALNGDNVVQASEKMPWY